MVVREKLGISMRPRERQETGEQDLFHSRLDQIIDMKHFQQSCRLSAPR